MELKQTATKGEYGRSNRNTERLFRRKLSAPLQRPNRQWTSSFNSRQYRREFVIQGKHMTLLTAERAGFLDLASSEPGRPYAIITADCMHPAEIDDGLIVQRTEGQAEAYRVGVCVVDTSSLYADDTIRTAALSNIEAKYEIGGRGGEPVLYEPMIDEGIIRVHEFKAGNVRDALILWFTVYRNVVPTDLAVEFGKVEVTANHNYRRFDALDRRQDEYRKFGRAAAFIVKNLIAARNEESALGIGMNRDVGVLFNRSKKLYFEKSLKRGSKINEAFMIAANHLVGKLFAEAELPAIYRVHGSGNDILDDDTSLAGLAPNVATYSLIPGPHEGLGLDQYCRATSPLRRLEDFMMLYHLRLFYEGKQPSLEDVFRLREATRELNTHVLHNIHRTAQPLAPIVLVNRFGLGEAA